MKSFLSKLFGTKASRPASIGRQTRLNVEALEERSLMSAAPIAASLSALTTHLGKIMTGPGPEVSTISHMGNTEVGLGPQVSPTTSLGNIMTSPGPEVLPTTNQGNTLTGPGPEVSTTPHLSNAVTGPGPQVSPTASPKSTSQLTVTTTPALTLTPVAATTSPIAREADEVDYPAESDDGDVYISASSDGSIDYPVPSSDQISQTLDTYAPPFTPTIYPTPNFSAIENPNQAVNILGGMAIAGAVGAGAVYAAPYVSSLIYGGVSAVEPLYYDAAAYGYQILQSPPAQILYGYPFTGNAYDNGYQAAGSIISAYASSYPSAPSYPSYGTYYITPSSSSYFPPLE